MTSNNLRNRYIQDGAGVVSQQKLLVMLYDRLITDCEQATVAIHENQLELTNSKLQHAQAIVLELNNALNPGIWDGAQSMSELYSWFDDELTAANVKKDASRIAPVLKMIKDLRETWNEALSIVVAEQTTTTPASAAAANAAAASENGARLSAASAQ